MLLPRATPAILHSVALGISLFVQSTSTPFAGMWLPFHLLACGTLLYRNDYPAKQSPVWWAALAWLLAVTAAGFVVNPVFNGANFMWVFIATPLLVLCLQKDDLPAYIKGFGTVILTYALAIAIQKVAGLGRDGRVSWPLLDPNNTAAVLNLALTPCVYLALMVRRRYAALLPLLLFALYATGSKTGIAAAAISISCLLTYFYGYGIIAAGLAFTAGAATMSFFYRPEFIVAGYDMLATRFPIWWASWQIMLAHPWRGVGIGFLDHYHVQQGATLYLPPAFAHNDILQFAAEMGIPVALVFCIFIGCVFWGTCKGNLVSGCTLLAIMIQAMMEFQFYLPSVTLGTGLIIAYHNLNGSWGRSQSASQRGVPSQLPPRHKAYPVRSSDVAGSSFRLL